jgi:hypothetical protein
VAVAGSGVEHRDADGGVAVPDRAPRLLRTHHLGTVLVAVTGVVRDRLAVAGLVLLDVGDAGNGRAGQLEGTQSVDLDGDEGALGRDVDDLEAVDGLERADRGGQVALDADDEAGGLLLTALVVGWRVLGRSRGHEREQEQAGKERGEEGSVHDAQVLRGWGGVTRGRRAGPARVSRRWKETPVLRAVTGT